MKQLTLPNIGYAVTREYISEHINPERKEISSLKEEIARLRKDIRDLKDMIIGDSK